MTAETMARTPRHSGAVMRALNFVGRSRELTLVAVMLVMVLFVTSQVPHFLTASNLGLVTAFAAIIAVAAVGEAIVVMTKNIDLSIEATMGLTAFVVGDILRNNVMPVPAAWLVGIGVGMLLGMFNGAIITLFRLPSIVVTLGTLSIYRGFVFIIAGGKEINVVQLPSGYTDPVTDTVLGIPVFVIVAIVIVIAMGLMLYRTRFGRRIYAVGSNPEAADILGIRSRWIVFWALALAGLLAGVAGIMWGMYFGTIYATSGSGVILQIVAAVVVGGVAISGGSGTVFGAALGALFLALINNALLVLVLPQTLLQAIYGAVILVAVTADALIARRQRRLAALRVRR
jgi:rhamnose transport system permease protein